MWSYFQLLRFAALFHTKARAWHKGRIRLFEHIEQAFADTPPHAGTTDRVWMHCASLGEFEQGRPLLEAIRARRPHSQIILTFFSPSGYEVRKHYAAADHVFYLPLDNPRHARKLLQLVRPTIAIFVKYEFWYYYLRELHRRQIPTYLISAIFRSPQPFFRIYGQLHRQMLGFFDHIFIQDTASAKLLSSVGVHQWSVTGDTRVDRVKRIAADAPRFPLVEQFLQTESVMVAGSTWQADEAIIADLIQSTAAKSWQFIIAPHEIKKTHIEQLCRRLQDVSVVLYSELVETPTLSSSTPVKVLIIDNIGMLSALYQYARVAYVGGGFGRAIHNILEPIAFAIPVIFGPRHQGFYEAVTLNANGGARVVERASDLMKCFVELQHPANYRQAASQAGCYIESQAGATATIYQAIFDEETEGM